MKHIKRALKIYKIFTVQELKRIMEYKGDFIVGVIAFLITQGFNILFLSIIFSQIPALMGWSFEQIVFIYGFSLLPKALDHLLFDNLWAIGHVTVRKGEFDKYLTRPINSLYHVMIERFQLDAFGEMIVAIGLMVYSIPQLAIEWSVIKVILAILVVPFSTLIYTAIKIATAALAFWIKKSGNVTYMFYMLNDFAKYPTDIYNKFIKTVITYIVPFAFTAFFPASYVITGENPLFNIGMTVVISSVLMAVSIVIWNCGVKVYESAGS